MTDAGPMTLHLAGERTVPGVAEENYWYRRHEVAYRTLLPHCAGATVVDTGCGEGYGTAMIADAAARVLALDYDAEATTHVRTAYGLPAVRANLAALPLRAGSTDVLANFQVLEHLPDQERFLAECHRVLRPDGTLLLTTPNRLTFSPGRETPLNPYHTREFAPAELDALLRAAGFEPRCYGVHHGPRLRALDARYGGSLIGAQLDVVMDSMPGQAQWPPRLLADVAAVRADDFEITDRELDACLDLVAVAVRA